MSKQTANLELWDDVSKTDPSYTKHVGQRGGFTAIDAQYQIMEATRAFGPCGIGWGYDCQAPIFTTEAVVIVPVTLWHGDRSNTFGPQFGSAEMVNSNGRVDGDAPKKATTDAITKLLSHLGFNADVFLGKFDDSKYVAKVQAEFEAKDNPHKGTIDDIMQMMREAKSIDQLQTAAKKMEPIKSDLEASAPGLLASVRSAYKIEEKRINSEGEKQ